MLDHACQTGRSPLKEHPGDCYDTPPEAVYALLKVEKLPPIIWEPACGTGNIVEVLRNAGHKVIATDLYKRGCYGSLSDVDFLMPLVVPRIEADAIVTNPPFSLAEEFVVEARARVPLVVMLMRLAFYESEKRTTILEGAGLARIHVFANRLPMMHRAGWKGRKASSSIPFAWYVWSADHRGPTTIDRIRWEPRCL